MTQFLLDNAMLIAIVVIAVGALAWPAIMTRRYGPEVSTREAIELINHKNAQIIDVNKPEDFKKGHIARSINYPADQIQNNVKDIDKNLPVLLVDRTGGRSRMAARLLRGVGFKDVYVLENGLLAWQKDKMPLE